MMSRLFFSTILLITFFASCSVSKKYNPDRKFTRQELQQDYTLLRNILEKKHPALYWYTSRDSMNFYFDSCYNSIADSMTELQFGWNVIAPLTQKIHCGHTSLSLSKNWYRFTKDRRIPSFPVYVKVWNDTMVITGNLNRNDSVLKKGTLITSINSFRNADIVKKLFQYLPEDGYADNVNYIRISSNFPYYHRNVFGLYKNYRVGYIDSTGAEKTTLVHMWNPAADTLNKTKAAKKEKIPRRQRKKERLENFRSFVVDSSINTAVITLNTFSNGGGRHLRSFIKKSFRKIHQQKINNLILDLRGNGGGDINMFALLTKYVRNKPFKVADTCYSVAKNFGPYSSYIKQSFFSNIGLMFLSKKRADGNYHFGYWERHWFHPKEKNHFDGKLYVLVNGPTFSASTLFCNAVKGQENVVIAGEETGGGWHGNSGVMIPDIVLPKTRINVRLPFFKLVQYNHVPKDGRGVLPDMFIPPTVEGVVKSLDRKMLIVKELIKQGSSSNQKPIVN